MGFNSAFKGLIIIFYSGCVPCVESNGQADVENAPTRRQFANLRYERVQQDAAQHALPSLSLITVGFLVA